MYHVNEERGEERGEERTTLDAAYVQSNLNEV